MFLIDSHCHIDKLNYNNIHLNITDVMNKAYTCDVKLILAVCTSLSDFNKIITITNCRKDILFSCGIHPLYIQESCDFIELRRLSKKNNVIAIGETGLDYYHNMEHIIQQKKIFRKHIHISREFKKPIIIHARNSFKDIFTILSEEQSEGFSGVLHCFTGDINDARMFLNLGLYISFSGIVTFRNAEKIREVVKYVPLDRLLLETDSPYLTPVPYRGSENQPAYLRNIAECVAVIKNVELEYLAKITSANFNLLFNINKKLSILY